MKAVRVSTAFKGDIKRIKKQGHDILKMEVVVHHLAKGEMLPPTYKDHALSGNLRFYRECHIASDWLLVYRVDDTTVILQRTGTHAELFSK